MLCQKNGQLAFPLCSVKGHIFVDLQIKEKFIAKSQLLCMKCPLTIERRQMKNPILCPRLFRRMLTLTGVFKSTVLLAEWQNGNEK